MTIVQCIERVTDWLNTNVCSDILLKLPDDDQNGKGYVYEEVHPTAFSMYQPGKDNPLFDNQFIFHSYGCRVGKGTTRAADRLQYWMQEVDRKPVDWYYLKLDISSSASFTTQPSKTQACHRPEIPERQRQI